MYEHKVVLFDKLGPGTHPCHWCGLTLRWVKGTAGDALIGDHLDGAHRNNAPDNLVASCNGCNTIRARRAFRPAIGDDEPYVTDRNGKRTRAVLLSCDECGSAFLASVSRVKRGTVSLCSNSCAGIRGSRNRWHTT